MMMTNDFKREVLDWADEIKVEPKTIQVREMRRKWASCSNKGRLTFSYELLEQSYGARANAIVHELLHLKHPNHGKLFKSLLAHYLNKKGIKVNIK